VGRSVCRRLAAAGLEVCALTHSDAFSATDAGISLDLTSLSQCDQLVDHCRGRTAVVHLAGRIGIALSAASDGDRRPRAAAAHFAEVYESNVVMTARLLEVALAADVPHFLLASSQTVYGLPSTPRLTEDTPLAPLEHYAASKIACETAAALWARGHGRMATILRIPGVWSDARRAGLVYSLCHAALKARHIRIGADYALPIDVLHCEDVAGAFEAALRRAGAGSRVYNVSGGEPCSLIRLAREVAALVPGCTVETYGVEQPEITLDAGRAAAELGWHARPRGQRLAEFLAELARS
jgi:nucleoside-diphosphate-sugar epimerase